MKKINIQISDEFLIKILMQSAQSCNTSVNQIVENILYARFAEYATRADVFNDPKKGILPELIIRDGQLIYKGKEVALFVQEITKKEFSQIRDVNDVIENLSQENFAKDSQGYNA